MAMFVVIQIALFSLAMAQQPFGENNYPDGWWFRVIPVRNASQFPEPPCLLRSQRVVKRDDYTYTSGIGGHKFHTQPFNWNAARKICEGEGGHLAIINSGAEAQVLVDLFSKSEPIVGATGLVNYAAIGIHDLFNEGEYLTLHSQSISTAGYDEWYPGQPDDTVGSENCGAIDRSGKLHDISCSVTRGFICEVPHY